ncbi:MAG: N-acetyltransferase [Chloroflexi bacterium]|nr:MAG: N-acetyltransferase [Chloroflexota bacterium]
MHIEVVWFPEESFPLTVDHFFLEKMVFNHIDGCPKSYAEFKRRYEEKTFVSATAWDREVLCGFKISERVTETHFHHHIIAVHPDHRRSGIGYQLSHKVGQALLARKVSHITLFAIPKSTALELEPDYIHPLPDSWGQSLGEEEISLLARLKSHKGSLRIDETQRVQAQYYTLADGSMVDALYKAYRIEG